MRYNYDKHNSYDGIVSRRENAVTRMNLLGGFFPAHNRVYLRANQALDMDRFLAGARAPVKSTMPGFAYSFPSSRSFFFRVHLYLSIIAESRLLSSLIFIHANYYVGEKLCLNIELRVITPGYIVFRGEIKAIGKEIKKARIVHAREYNLIYIDIQHSHACP